MRRVSNGLVGLGSAAVLTIYGAGYLRTRPAAARIALAAERRPVSPAVVAPELPAPAALVPAGTPESIATPAPVPAPDAAPDAAKPRPVRTPPPPVAKAAAPVATAAVHAPAAHTPGAARPASPATPVDATPSDHPAGSVTTPELPAVAAVVPEAAAVPVTAPPAAAPIPAAHWKDGTYLGWGSSRHGDIQASVEVRDGRIVSATIAQCLTRYSCSWIAALPPQVVARQSPETDYVSGATQSTNAFYYAVVEALGKAK